MEIYQPLKIRGITYPTGTKFSRQRKLEGESVWSWVTPNGSVGEVLLSERDFKDMKLAASPVSEIFDYLVDIARRTEYSSWVGSELTPLREDEIALLNRV